MFWVSPVPSTGPGQSFDGSLLPFLPRVRWRAAMWGGRQTSLPDGKCNTWDSKFQFMSAIYLLLAIPCVTDGVTGGLCLLLCVCGWGGLGRREGCLCVQF